MFETKEEYRRKQRRNKPLNEPKSEIKWQRFILLLLQACASHQSSTSEKHILSGSILTGSSLFTYV